MAEFQLKKGEVTLVDDDVVPLLAARTWRVDRAGYVGRQYTDPTTKKMVWIFLHRLVTAAPTGMQVDHCNQNKLDNRRANLRIASMSQNMGNRKKPSNKPYSSRFKGVTLHRKLGRWQAMCQDKYIGLFDDETTAARAYDAAALAAFGEFASLNFPESRDVK
jgi:hypothetical protein